MEIIELNHWYLNKNELLIHLMRFFVKIEILKNNKFIYYRLYIREDKNKELTFNFYTIEDAIVFTEKIVNKCHNTNEILEKYISMFNENMFINPYQKKKEKRK